MTLSYLMEWANLLLRWAHVIVGIAWIGASFYFVWLESHLEREGKRKGIAGDLWAIHGGGFYFVQKYQNAPETLPDTLHWFKYEAYFTWITGFLLLSVVYYFNAASYMVDASKIALAPWMTVVISLLSLVGGWFAYHKFCESNLGKNNRIMFACTVLFVLVISFVLDLMIQNKAVFLHIGAILGTMMAGNVFFVIIPNQKKAVAQMIAGEEPEASLGQQSLRRSLHNNYFTLPVIFMMISNHYPMVFGHQYNWVVLVVLALIGVGIRHWFNLKNKGKAVQGSWALVAALAGIVLLVVMLAPKQMTAGDNVAFADVRAIVDRHCVACHSSRPSSTVFTVAPKGLMFDDDKVLQANAMLVQQQAVLTNTMPLVVSADTPVMTEQERQTLGQWIAQGAKL